MKFKQLLWVFLLGLVIVTPLSAMESDHPVNFYLNFGIMTDDSFSFDPFLWYGGFNFDFHLNDYIMLTPEANLVLQDFKFDVFVLDPAVLLNLKLEAFFVGAGIGKMFIISGDYNDSTDFFLKLNAGFSGDGGLRFRVFLETSFDNLFKGMTIGAQLGIGI